tara:strand:- start:28865 stop:34543 length:5679 start_codon:yes stop_codon:yes gene_type:complete
MAALTAAAIANWDAEMIMQMGLVNTVAGPVPLTWKANLVVGDAITITSLADHGESLLWIIAAAQSVVGIDAQQSEDSIFGILLGGPANEPGGFLHAGSSPNGNWFGGDINNPQNQTLANVEEAFGITSGRLQTTVATGNVPGAGGGGGGGGGYTPGGPTIAHPYPWTFNTYHNLPGLQPDGFGGYMNWYNNNLLDPHDELAGMGGITAYNTVEGHFFLKQFPDPTGETVNKTVQGFGDSFESKYENMGVESIISPNDKVDVTEVVYQGVVSSKITSSEISTFTATGTSVKTGAIVIQGGFASNANHKSSSYNKIIGIRVEDIRPFALKGLDIDHEALWDWTNPGKATNKNYVRHISPESEPRVATINIQDEHLQYWNSFSLPSSIDVYYSAIDRTGQVMTGGGGNFGGNFAGAAANDANDFVAMASSAFTGITDMSNWNFDKQYGWLIVEKTVPSAEQVYYNRTTGAAFTIADILRRPINNNTYPPIPITAPGGLITIPTKSVKRKLGSHTLSMNPTGDFAISSFVDLDDTPFGRMLIESNKKTDNSLGFVSKQQPYGIPKTIASTRTPVKHSRSAYNTLRIGTNNPKSKITTAQALPTALPVPSKKRIMFEQFDVIDNILLSDRHLLLIHPSDRKRSGTLSELITPTDNSENHHIATIEMSLMRGRAEEIAPTTGEEGESLVIRGRSQLVEISDSQVDQDYDLGQGHPVKEIGDMGSPVVSLTMGGLGQGGIDIKPSRTEHSKLPIWKDRIFGSGNASVRNDKQTSTYVASTRALVEIPIFPSMMFDVDKRIATSETKRSPLPTTKAMEMVVDCTMTAINRPHMQQYESRYSVDWGLKNKVSMLRINDPEGITSNRPLIIRCMREQASSFLRASSHSTSEDNAHGSSSGTYIEVDSVLPFINEGGLNGITPHGGGDQAWALDADGAAPDGSGFIATVGEGILGSAGIRLYIYKITIVGDSHRLYYTRFHNPLAEGTTAAQLIHYFNIGLPVVMGGWLRTDAYHGTASNTNLASLQVSVSGLTATSIAQSFAQKIEYTLGMRLNLGTSRISLDPSDSTGATILINDGPSMEGLQFDPGHELYGASDIPLKPFVECQTGYLAAKGKKKDRENLTYVMPQHLNFGEIGSIVADFDGGVDEIIRRINQAGHPMAKNANGGSAFDPPTLFATDEGDYTVTDTNTGSHMGYVRAFIGKSVESRDGESGVTIVIHSTIPGATSRNFAIWFNNNSPYPYRPIQAIGHGGLLATNSRSYQASSFAAPLPLGMDGETHIPITTFQGGIIGGVEVGDVLRKYEGIGNDYGFKSVRLPRYTDDTLLPIYNSTTQPRLWVDRKALDILYRAGRTITHKNPGTVLVDDKYLATFDSIDTLGSVTNNCKATGVGSCCALVNLKPVDSTKTQKFIDLFLAKDGTQDSVDIVMVDPLLDANGILFFGGGHTGVTFDVSDGTANDYSDFYTHHYAKGPTGYSGIQNLQEIQTSAAVLDFTEINNEDTAKENSYAGIHYADDNCIFYLRMNHPDLVGDYKQNSSLEARPEYKAIENKFGYHVGMVGNWERQLEANGASSPLYLSSANHGDQSSRGVQLNPSSTTASTNGLPHFPGLVLHSVADYANQTVAGIGPIIDSIHAQGPWSVTFMIKPHSVAAAWGGGSNAATIGGPIFHMIDENGYPLGVSILARQHDLNAGSNNSNYNIKVVVHHRNTATGTTIQTTYTTSYSILPKASWSQLTVVKPLNGNPVAYLGGTALQLSTATDAAHATVGAYQDVNDSTYRATNGVANHPRLYQQVGMVNDTNKNNAGVVVNWSSGSPTGGFYGRIARMATIGIALHGCPIVGGAQLNNPSFGGGTGTYCYGYVSGGASGAGLSTPTYFKGKLAEVGIWNKALSSAEATALGNKVWD